MSRRLRTSFLPIILISIALFSTPVDVLYGDWSDPGSSIGVGVSDHGGLTGLTDDDHTQYLERDGSDTFAGDLVPDSDSSRSLGSTLVRWLNGWFDAITVGGNITVGGTVDGRDIAADGTALDLIDAETLLLDGTRAMTGNLDMGSQAITSVGNVDGRDVSADGSTLDGLDAEPLWSVDWDMGSLYPCSEAGGLPAGIDGPASIASHPTPATIKVAAYDDTADECRHRSLLIPTGTASIQVRITSYAETCSSCSTTAKMAAAFMPLSNATWQTAQSIDVVAPGNTTAPVEDASSAAAVATWGVVVGERHNFALIRDGDNSSDDLTDDLFVVGLRIEGYR